MAQLDRHRQRGAAALFVIALLCFVMVLAVALAQRNVLVEEQRSANDLHASAAFEAAEAGLEWALARINDPTPIDTACLPSADGAALPFRARMLRIDANSGAIAPTTWSEAGVARPLQAACSHGAEGWTCSCAPTLRRPSGDATALAFFVELAAVSRPGVVRVVATACTPIGDDGACAADNAAGREASARNEAAWALLPALRSPPAAALTAGGDIDVGAAPLGVHNVDGASSGLALHVGGRIAASALRITVPAGASLGASIASGDAALRDVSGDRLFARFFGMGSSAWAAQPAVRRIACAGDCTAAVADAIASGARLLAIDGDAVLRGPIVLGAAEDSI